MRILWWTGVLCSVFVGILYSYQWLYLLIPRLCARKKTIDGSDTATTAIHMPKIAVCIAARNEEAVLPHLLDSIRMQTEQADVYVIADNCTDQTAVVARAGGAVVYERHNLLEVGKGYALCALWDNMRASGMYERYDAFLILDADNLLRQDYIAEIAKTMTQGHRIVTGFRNVKNFGGNWITSGYGIWFLHESVHMNQSRALLGTSAAVSGTGFCIRRDVLEERGGWIYHSLTEDIAFWTDTVARGEQIAYCPRAILYDEQPERFTDSVHQRVRWIRGGIQASFQYGGRLLQQAVGRGKTIRQRYAALECATLSFWGYGTSCVVSLIGAALCFVYNPFSCTAPIQTLMDTLFGYCMCTLLTAAATVYEAHDQLHVSRRKLFCAVLTYPLFVASYVVPIVLALVRKPTWKPIPHRCAIGMQELQKQ